MTQVRARTPEPPRAEDQSRQQADVIQEELDRVAEEAAQKAERDEQAYDADHGIFTK